MSLIQLSSEGSVNNSNNNFTCYFNRGIKIKKNSKIGLVSATLQHIITEQVSITDENNTFFVRYGQNPYINRTLECKLPTGSYDYARLAQAMELEISKNQGYLPYKKLTKLNGAHLSDDWLAFGTNVTPTINSSGVLTAIKITEFQTPSSNTGAVAVDGKKILEAEYYTAPLKSNFKNYTKNTEGLSRDLLKEIKGVYNDVVVSNDDGNSAIQAIILGVTRAGTADRVIPVVCKEYISLGHTLPIYFGLDRPTFNNSWGSANNRSVGLISWGDIKDHGSSLMEDEFSENPALLEKAPMKIGVRCFTILNVATLELYCLNKVENDNQELGSGVVLSDAGLVAGTLASGSPSPLSITLSDSEDEYFVEITNDTNLDGDLSVGSVRIRVSADDEFAAANILMVAVNNEKKCFFGTKAYPLVPIFYNKVIKAQDETSSTITMWNSGDNESLAQFTNAAILDSECMTSFPSDIPYDPMVNYKMILQNKDATINYPTGSGTGGTGFDDNPVVQTNFTGSIFYYFNEETELTKTANVNINDLITGNVDGNYDLLHPIVNATLAGVLGLFKRVYTQLTADATTYKGGLKLEETGLLLRKNLYLPSYHIQIGNLPIQSLNSFTKSVCKTIAVISKTDLDTEQTTITPSEIVYIDLNNGQELMINDLNVKITESDNTLTNSLYGAVEVICMIKD